MRIYGELIGKLTARTNRDSALIDRVLEVYITKTTIKFYLFKSYNIGWHRECNVVFQTIIKKEDDANKVIKKIMRDYNLNFDGHITIDNKNILEYLNGIEYRPVTNGWYGLDKNDNYVYNGEYINDCYFFKNLDAWEYNYGVIHISEGELLDLHEEYEEEGKINVSDLWTKQSWIEWVKNTIKERYQDEEDINDIIECNQFIENLAYDVLQNAEWQDLSTLFDDYDYNDDWVLDNWKEWKKNNN